jgi:hypothetical protein
MIARWRRLIGINRPGLWSRRCGVITFKSLISGWI